MRRCASAVLPVSVEARLSMRPFTLRQRRLTFRSVPAAGLTLLACIFEAIPKPAPDPFGFALPPPFSFLSPYGARSTCSTRCQVWFWNSTPVDRTFAPLQDLTILRDQSARSDSRRRSLPLQVARSSFAPRDAKNNLLFVLASDHRSGSATSCQAHCLSNLLEPSS